MRLIFIAAFLVTADLNLVDEALKKFTPKNMVSEEDLSKAFVFKTDKSQIFVLSYDAVVSGGLTTDEILAVIRGNLKPIAECYEKVLADKGSISCSLKTEIEIGASGAVTASKVRDGTNCEPELNACVTEIFRKMKFPVPRGGSPVKVVYPFVFKPL